MIRTLGFALFLTYLLATTHLSAQNVVYRESFDSQPRTQTSAIQALQTHNGLLPLSGKSRFTTEPIALPAGGRPLSLQVRSRFVGDKGFGIGQIWLSTNHGATWSRFRAIDGNDRWQDARFDLSRFEGQHIQLAFLLPEEIGVESTRWEIDEFRIIREPALLRKTQRSMHDIAIRSLNANLFPLIFMNVTVDTNGAPFPDLQESNFVVCENNVPQTDLFQVTPPGNSGGSRLADIVFIMDNSGSLGDEQTQVRDNMIAFVDSLTASGVDFALGLCRYGQSANGGAPIIEDNGQLTTDANYFKHTVWARNRVDGFNEPGYLAIVESATSFNFRPGARRIFIIITDETADQGGATQKDAITIAQNNSVNVYSLIDSFFITTQTDLFVVSEQTGGKAFNITDPFDAILDDIRGALSNTYIVRYRSSQPVADGVERLVKVVATYNAGSDSAFTTYTPGAAPFIRRDSATVALSNQSWPQNTAFTITAIIYDAASPSTQSATLFYKNTNDNTYTLLPMNRISQGPYPLPRSDPGVKTHTAGALVLQNADSDTSVWSATIPGSDVFEPGVDYYITATDGISTTSAPAVNPQSSPFQIAVLPNKAPVIVHTVPAGYQPGVALQIQASASDNTNKLVSFNLMYRRIGDILYQSVAMQNIGGTDFIGTIPANFITENGVEYILVAVDDFGVATRQSYRILPQQNASHIEVLEPNGAEQWIVCTQRLIRWTAINVSTVKIEYSLDGGASWQQLATGVAADQGQISWTIPNTPSSTVLIRVTDETNQQISDQSDTVFGINPYPQVQHWTLFNSCNIGLFENYIRALVVNCAGVVFLGTKSSGLVVYDNGTLSQYHTGNSPMPNNSILALALQGDKTVWIGTNGSGLVRWDGQDWKVLTTATQLPHNRVWSILVDKRYNDVWVGTSNGLAKYNQSGLRVFRDELPNTTVYALLMASDGRLWVGTAGGLLVYNGVSWTHYEFANSGLVNNTVVALAEDKLGRVWTGTPQGISRFDGSRWDSFTMQNSGLPSNNVRAIVVDANDIKWIATWGGGLAKFGSQWSVYNTNNSGLQDNYLLSLFIDCFGYKWIGTEQGGFNRFDAEPAVAVSVAETGTQAPRDYDLEQNYPNPFNPSTTIRYSLPRAGHVSLRIFDLRGREIARLVEGQQPAGTYTITWDAKGVASGVYIYKIEAGRFVAARKLILIK